jgi:glycosyltransferase involved in cell wall biosynthesis
MKEPLVSIIVCSYNYERFLKACVDSALMQTYPNIEIVVVDDGSTDASQDIISSYGTKVSSVLREKNAGAKATYNAAIELTKGDYILYLDSDDILDRNAIGRAVELFRDPEVTKVHWPLRIIDADGNDTGKLAPSTPLPEGDFRALIPDKGPFAYGCPPTSGNIYRRDLLARILPFPRGAYVDDYPSMWAMVYGRIGAVHEPLGYYRVHGTNNYENMIFDEKLKKDLAYLEFCCNELGAHYRAQGISIDTEEWKRNSWHWQNAQWVNDITRVVPEGDTLILVDEGWTTSRSIAGRQVAPFLERNGDYWGRPPDDETAIKELERMRREGAHFIVFLSHTFWWLVTYPQFDAYLHSQYKCVLQNERTTVFEITGATL